MRVIFHGLDQREVEGLLALTKGLQHDRLVTGDTDEEVEGDFEAAFCSMSSLFDAVEKALPDEVDRARELVAGRFDMIEKCGFRVEVTGMPASGEDN